MFEVTVVLASMSRVASFVAKMRVVALLTRSARAGMVPTPMRATMTAEATSRSLVKSIFALGEEVDVAGRESRDECAVDRLSAGVCRVINQSIVGRRVGSAGEVRAQPQSPYRLLTPPSFTITYSLQLSLV